MYCFKSKKLFHILNLFSKVRACNFSSKGTLKFERLRKRNLLKLSGSETNSFLQSMMTNDVTNFESLSSLYSLLLNSKGRVLYDIILYKSQENEYLIEYDSTATEYIEKHLIMYRLRKDVKIKPLSDIKAWVIFKPFEEQIDPNISQTIIDQLNKINGVIKAVEDPRMKELGIRVLTENSVNLEEVLPSSFDFKTSEEDSYRLLRYQLGVGEGVLDHPPGECIPFEINVDILNGVSFTKGCYIGQEMTARSRHVFIIRKRLVPVLLQKLESYPVFPPECPVINEANRIMGRFRSHYGQWGLGLLKFEECAKSKVLKLKDLDITLTTTKPKWWPSDLKGSESEMLKNMQ